MNHSIPIFNKKVILFLGLTFLVDWFIALVIYLSGIRQQSTLYLVYVSGYMLIPASMVFLLIKLVYKESIQPYIGESLKPNLWWITASLTMPIIALLTMVTATLFPGIELSNQSGWLLERFADSLTPEQISKMQKDLGNPPFILGISALQAVIAGLTVNAFFGFGEELGWRGFLHREWKHLGFWPMSYLIGFIWGIWHAPIILMGHNYPDHPVIGVFMMTVGTVLLSPVFVFFRERGRSSIAAAIAHGSFNASFGLSVIYLNTDNDLFTGSLGLPGFITLALANLFIFVVRKSPKFKGYN